MTAAQVANFEVPQVTEEEAPELAPAEAEALASPNGAVPAELLLLSGAMEALTPQIRTMYEEHALGWV